MQDIMETLCRTKALMSPVVVTVGFWGLTMDPSRELSLAEGSFVAQRVMGPTLPAIQGHSTLASVGDKFVTASQDVSWGLCHKCIAVQLLPGLASIIPSQQLFLKALPNNPWYGSTTLSDCLFWEKNPWQHPTNWDKSNFILHFQVVDLNQYCTK